MLKQDVLTYLTHHATPDAAAEVLEVSCIADDLKEPSSRVKEALADLERDDQVESLAITEHIFLPKTEVGKQIKKRVVTKRGIAQAPYIGVVVGLIILYEMSRLYLSNLMPAQELNAFILFVVGGLLVMYLINVLVARVQMARAVSDETLKFGTRLAKRAIVVFVILYMGILFVFGNIGWEMSGSIAVVILGIAVAISISLSQLAKQRDESTR